jgi:hypothetical protein
MKTYVCIYIHYIYILVHDISLNSSDNKKCFRHNLLRISKYILFSITFFLNCAIEKYCGAG